MGNWNQDSSGLSDEDMDQSLQQDIAMAGAMADGAQTTGNYTFGGNFVNDADNPGYTGPSTNMNQAVTDMQSLFNAQRGITPSNPYGKEGLFSRVLGIDPSKIDYSANMNLNTRMGIANNQFSKYMNPQNVKGQIGYNPAYDTAEKGKLRAGVQDAGYQTVYGPVMEQARKQGTGEMLARGAMGLAGGPIGMALAQIGTKEYGLPGVTGFDSFDPNNPRPGGGLLGQFLGGLNPTQAKDALVGAFAPVAPAPTPTQIDIAPPNLTGFENRFSQHPLTGEKTAPALGTVFEVDGRSFIAGKNGPIELSGVSLPNFRSENPAEATIDKGQGQILGIQDYLQNQFAAPADQFYTLNDKMNLDLNNARPDAPSGIQNTGLFGEDPRTAGFSNLQDNIQSIINNEPLPDNQNMYGPGMQDQAPLTPDELNNILEPYGMELGRGPSSGGIMQLAGATGGTDVTNMTQDERGMYRVGKDSNAIQRAFEALGLRPSKRGPSGQFYSPNKSRSFFDNPVGYVLGS
jgi:hypothetical protein